MRLFRGFALAAVLACASLSTTACTPGALGGGGIASAGDTVMLEGTRGFIVAEQAYIGIASAALDATRRGQITGSRATQLRALNARATALLQAGYAAQTVAAKATAARGLFDIVSQIGALIPARR